MSSDVAIKVEGLSKCYQVYDQPRDRLKQFVVPRLRRTFGLSTRQYFREFWAVRNVSFEVKKGETVGIVGRNGSGKSTLLQMICGTLNPTCGTIQTKGRIAALLELGSGFNPEFTGRENVYLNAAVLGLSRHEIDERFDDIAAFAEIGDFIDQPVKTYSSGMVVRLAFSVAINVDPEILVVDEALSVGDEVFQRKCFSRIETIRASGATVLFVSHSGSQIIEFCDYAVLVDSGEKISMGLPREIVSHYQKLLYAPKEKQQGIRAEILNVNKNDDSTADYRDSPALEKLSSDVGELDEAFDPNLVPTSTIEYESHGPLIGLPIIRTQDGRQVNGLLRGKKYRYCYQVVFHQAASKVRFGMSIKSTTGFSIAGALSAPSIAEAISSVDEGEVVDVVFTFSCLLNPGVYFMNAGVFGVKDGEETVLHRRADIVAFRVLPVASNLETEMVSLDFEPMIISNV